MDPSLLPSPSTESTGPMTDVQNQSDQQQSLAVLDKFGSFPTEIRVKIWGEALDEDAKTRFLLYQGSFGPIGANIGDRSVIFPHKKLRSSLLEVNRESRWIGLKFYHLELQVYPRVHRVVCHVLDGSVPPESWVARPIPAPLGVVHIRPEQDAVLYLSPFHKSYFPQIGRVKCATFVVSAEAREKFQHVWLIDTARKAYGVLGEIRRPVIDRVFESVSSHLKSLFPRNEEIVRFETQTIHALPDRNILSGVLDRILAGGFSDVRKHYAEGIRVYDRDGREKPVEDERHESPDENADS